MQKIAQRICDCGITNPTLLDVKDAMESINYNFADSKYQLERDEIGFYNKIKESVSFIIE